MEQDRQAYDPRMERRSIAQAFLDGCQRLAHGFSVILQVETPQPRPPMSIAEMNRRDAEDMARDWQATGDDLRKSIQQFNHEIGRE